MRQEEGMRWMALERPRIPLGIPFSWRNPTAFSILFGGSKVERGEERWGRETETYALWMKIAL